MNKYQCNQQPSSIKSFALRKGRITTAQKIALATLLPVYGIDYSPGNLIDCADIFQRTAPIVLEIGFGNGQILLNMAKKYPAINFIGIEVYQAGIAKLLLDIKKDTITNIRIINGDAVDILQNYIANESINVIQLFFPDPWPKARHHKRRIIQPNFVSLLAEKLLPKGVFRITTDWENYATHTLTIINNEKRFIMLNTKEQNASVLDREITKFEHRGQLLGHDIYEFILQKV